ncbi:MAG: dTDP-4-dehydrorhamnose reductase [Candidatus Dormibacteraeota bacterium]|nr:dTDP-4-dehydrorhamnose reductase [Candidatus Dormibacteraeota bacterium]
MRVLITGAAGQLGNDLIALFKGEEIHATDVRELDVTDRSAVDKKVEAVKPDWIINAAAYNNVDAAETNEDLALAINARAPRYIADAARRSGAALVHISTDYVFDGRKGSPYVEDDVPNPLGAYGRSKYEGEKQVLQSGAAAVVLRTAWLYGKHGPPSFVKAILAAADRQKELRVVADQVGSPTSSADLATAIQQAMVGRARGLFHVTNSGVCSRFEFAQAIVAGRVPVVPITTAEMPRPAARPAYSALRSIRWEQAGFAPLRPWREALDEYLATP